MKLFLWRLHSMWGSW